MNIICVLLAILPEFGVTTDYCDAIECNRVYDECGDVRFTQSLWLELDGVGRVKSWRFYGPEHMPVCGWSLFYDKGVLRGVRVPQVIHSSTRYDVEIENRKVIPLVWRRPLRGEQ